MEQPLVDNPQRRWRQRVVDLAGCSDRIPKIHLGRRRQRFRATIALKRNTKLFKLLAPQPYRFRHSARSAREHSERPPLNPKELLQIS
jgi:hypothetical protein